MKRRGTCCCGECAIVVTGDHVLNAVCNCDNCKRRTGSGFGWNAYFADSQIVEKTGPLVTYQLAPPFDQVRSFCGHCGTTLFWTTPFMPNHHGIAGGCFTALPLAEPNQVYAPAQGCAWLRFPLSWERK